VKNSDWRECVANVNDFSYAEKLLLSYNFSYYWALYNEERPAVTIAQSQFIENCYNGVPNNKHEAVFYKFLEKTGNVEALADEADEVPAPDAEPEVSARSDLVGEAIDAEPREHGSTAPKTDEVELPKGEIENDFHPVRGPASVDDILGGANGKPPPVLDTDVPLDGFGDRDAWDRMRGRRKRQG
jgi:hypothetical protein